MSNLYRGPSIDAYYQVLVHLIKWFRNRRFSWKSTNQKQELPMAAMFVFRWGRNIYRAPSIDASYHASVHFAKQFQRRRFLEIDQSEKRIACGGHVC